MRRFLQGSLLLGALVAGAASASELRISFGDSSLRAEYLQAVGQSVGDSAPTVQAGVLYREEDDQDGTLGHLGLVIYGDAGTRKAIVQAGIGGRVYLISTDPSNTNGGALAMGGVVSGRVPGIDRIGGFGEIWFAPEVSSFADLDRVFEVNLGVEYQLLRQAAIGIGWRHVDLQSRNFPGTVDYEDSAFVAFKFLF